MRDPLGHDDGARPFVRNKLIDLWPEFVVYGYNHKYAPFYKISFSKSQNGLNAAGLPGLYPLCRVP